MAGTHSKNLAKIKKADDELQVVYAEVYAPDRPDSDGDFMTVTEVRKMAHRFNISGRADQVDTQHDNELNGSCVVESWVQQEPSEFFIENAWVVGIHVPDANLWAAVKSGEISGFSMEALVQFEDTILEVEIPEDGIITGLTLADDSDHVHTWKIQFSPDGDYLGGCTNEVNGHRHLIRDTTKTVKADTDGHLHRIFVMESIVAI